MKAKGLGRGLDALLSGPDVLEEKPAEQQIPINRIDAAKDQPRKHFDEESLRELADSIRQHGVIQPLILRKEGDRYSIVAGERRYRAARMAGLREVPAIVKEYDARQVLEVSIIENIQREDLNPIEEAEAIALLMREYGLSQEQVAARLGRSRRAGANSLRLTALPDRVAAMVVAGELSAGHARALLPLKEEKRLCAAAAHVVARGLSVRETEKYAKTLLATPTAKREPRTDPDILHAQEALSDKLETRVRIQGNRDSGKIVLSYFSPEQLDALYERLTR